MKRFLGVAVLIGLTSPAFAQSATGIGVGVSQSNSTSASNATAIGGGNATGGNATSNANANPKAKAVVVLNGGTPANTTSTLNQTLKNVPTEFAPGLTSAGLETCLGSVSGGGAALGWGASFGTTIPDPGCAARLDARTLWSMGLKKAAVIRLCLMPDIYRSMPEVCNQYIPQAGYATTLSVARVTPAVTAEAIAAQPISSEATHGPIQVRERKTGQWRTCNDYDTTRQRCLVWARE